MSISHEERLAFTEEDLAGLPSSFPPCLIRDGTIARADGLPLEWGQYDLLDKNFPATLTESGQLQILLRPKPARAIKAKNLVKLLDYYLSCQPGGETYLGPELRIRPYRRSLVPDVMYFRNPNPEWEKSATYIDQIPDLAVEIVSPSNLGKKWENNLAFYRQLAFPEVWLVQLDRSVEIWRSAQPKMNAARKPGELFSSPLFPGMAIDPAWLMDYPNEIKRIDQFSPDIIVSPSVVNPDLTKRAYELAGRIAQHFGKTYHPADLQSEIGREAGRRKRIAQEPPARREQNPGREQER
jgi:Uma2 family endonuclease